MGMAASQARLLSITSRLADNELRSQTINNAKMRLSSETAQASEDYLNALNNAQLVFSNYDSYGNEQQQQLTFNALMGYSPYNNQYGLINSAGQILVSEADAAAYESSHGDLNTFLSNYGLEFDTSYFEHLNAENFMDPSIDYTTYSYFYGMTSDEVLERLQEIYEESEGFVSSAEYNEFYSSYDGFASAYSNLSVALKDTFVKQLTSNSSSYTNSGLKFEYNYGNFKFSPSDGKYSTSTENYLAALYNIIDETSAGWGINKLKDNKIISDDVYEEIKGYINSVYMSGSNTLFEEYDKCYLDETEISSEYKYLQNGTTEATMTSGKIYTDETYLPGLKIVCDNNNRVRNIEIDDEYSGAYALNFKASTMDSKLKDYDKVIIKDNGRYEYTTTSEEEYTYYSGQNGNLESTTTDSYGTITEDNKNIFSENDMTLDQFMSMLRFYGDYDTESSNVLYDYYNTIPYSFRNSYSAELEGDNKIVFGIGQSYSNEDIKKTSTQNSTVTTTVVSNECADFFNDMINSIYSYVLNNLNLDVYANKNENNIELPISLTTYRQARDNYIDLIFDNKQKNYGDNKKYNGKTSAEIMKYLINTGEFSASDLTSVDMIMFYADSYGLKINSKFETLIKDYIINDFMIPVFGEPSYSWQDVSDRYLINSWSDAATDSNNVTNPNIKVTWYSNLFTRMQQGYKVLEDGLASSADWLEFALESGTVSMEQINSSNAWTSLDYKSCTKITEKTVDDAAVAIAEAKYTRAMNDIQTKDQIYDMQLKNIDTEHSALQTEYDSVKNALNKNIERTMKFDQSG